MTRLFVALTLLGTLLLTAVTGASAGSAGGVRADTMANVGTFTTLSGNFANPKKVGDDTIFELTATFTYTGRLTGTSVIRGNLISHADGSANFYEIETFTGTVDGVPGVVTFYLTGGAGADAAYEATATVLYAPGELAGLTGELHTVGVVRSPTEGPAGTYTADFDQGGDTDDGE